MYLEGKSNYNKYPTIKIDALEKEAFQGYETILKELKSKITKDNFVLVVDCYPGVRDEEVLPEIKKLNPDTIIHMETIFKDKQSIDEQIKYQLTDDRVFGKIYAGEVLDFIDLQSLEDAKQQVGQAQGLTIVYGFGAALVSEGDLLVYLDLARWEIQQRYRNGMGNYKADNGSEDLLRKYKRGFFLEWRIADKHKLALFEKLDYLMDTNKADNPKMITGNAFLSALKKSFQTPFRTVPYFDDGVWGGKWMKEVCDLDPDQEKFAWSFDGVPEENSIFYDFGGVIAEVPAMDLVLYHPKELLGEHVFARFGAEFPIRFDFLDTVEGQNLSLQVHPLTEYIKKEFGMQYTQDESYYMLDAKEGASVYLGLKEGINPDEMMEDLYAASRGDITFEAEKYVNEFPAKKHDHFLIPAGTVHCSGSNAMILEISATPYIFTFKLWDWGRVGLDGKPRPIHIEHGEKVIQWDRTTKWVEDNLINDFRTVHEDDDYIEEHTGLHELEFIETRRYWFDDRITIETNETFHMLNLIEGKEAVVESTDQSFEPFHVHYAETFIVPAHVRSYTVRPVNAGEKLGLIKAYVR